MVLSFLCALAALVVAFLDQTCNPQMSTWQVLADLQNDHFNQADGLRAVRAGDHLGVHLDRHLPPLHGCLGRPPLPSHHRPSHPCHRHLHLPHSLVQKDIF